MDLGYFAMPLHPPGTPPAEFIEADLRQIEVLDELGYAEAWIGEHYTLPWEPVPSPEIFIAAALQRTKSIRLGTGVSCLPSHHPVHVATRIAFLDHLARGRLNFGVGVSGFNESELWDLDWRTDEHRRKFHDMIDVIVALWEDPKPGHYEYPNFSFTIPEPETGYQISFHHRPYQQPHPPIAVAAMTPTSASLRMAGGRGWIPMSINFVPTAALTGSWATYEDAALAAGRSPDRAIWRIAREVLVAESSETARSEALQGSLAAGWKGHILPALPRLQVPVQAITGPDVDIADGDHDALLEWCCDNLWIVGDIDEVTDKLNALYDEVGGFGTLLAMGHEWDEAGVWERSMHLLRDEVQPRLRSLAPAPA